MRSYYPVDSKAVPAPNTDTLYTIAWLDVSKEPSVIKIPDMGDRYYMLPMLDGWSNVFSVPSTRTTGQKAQTYVITGPGWSGALPSGVSQIKAPTGMVWVLGRIYSTGTPEDYVAVHAIQDQITAQPLSSYGRSYSAPAGVVDQKLDMKTPTKEQVDALSTNDFFAYFSELVKTNPPLQGDRLKLDEIAQIGIVPGKDFDSSKLAAYDPVANASVPKLARKKMGELLSAQKLTNGWQYFTNVGDYGTDYLMRALANWMGPGWNRPQDAVYPISLKSADGSAYDGSKHSYLIHFGKGMMPPVKGFWSLTLYDDQYFLVPNSINRYTLSQRDKLVENADGSVDLYLQSESPGAARQANWLPAPKGPFTLMLRLYWPSTTGPSLLDGTWQPPLVQTGESPAR